MIIETATVYTFCALVLMMIIITVYFMIFFMIWYVIGWGLQRFLSPIIKLISSNRSI